MRQQSSAPTLTLRHHVDGSMRDDGSRVEEDPEKDEKTYEYFLVQKSHYNFHSRTFLNFEIRNNQKKFMISMCFLMVSLGVLFSGDNMYRCIKKSDYVHFLVQKLHYNFHSRTF